MNNNALSVKFDTGYREWNVRAISYFQYVSFFQYVSMSVCQGFMASGLQGFSRRLPLLLSHPAWNILIYEGFTAVPFVPFALFAVKKRGLNHSAI